MSEELIKLREEINAIDNELVKLIARRLRVVRDIAMVKVKAGLRLVDDVREVEVLRRVRTLGEDLGVKPEYVELIFRVLMLISLREEVELAEWCKERSGCGSSR